MFVKWGLVDAHANTNCTQDTSLVAVVMKKRWKFLVNGYHFPRNVGFESVYASKQ